MFQLRPLTPGNFRRYVLRPTTYVQDLPSRLRRIGGVDYDVRHGSWTVPAEPDSLQRLKQEFGANCYRLMGYSAPRRDASSITPDRATTNQARKYYPGPVPAVWQSAYHRVEEQLRVERYSPRTVKSYLNHLKIFFLHHAESRLEDINTALISQYIVSRVAAGRYSESTQNQLLNALKFWLEKVEGREKAFYQLRPRRKKQLPNVLSRREVEQLLAATPNLKHRCILMTIYSGGLRLGEVCRLRLVDIHTDRGLIFVGCSKGKRDRYTTLSQSLLEELRRYYKVHRPKYWLFEGRDGGRYSPRSVQAILRRSVAASGVNPLATVHTLRHSYATHLLESGTSLRHIQELLGHASSTTTEIYTHVTRRDLSQIVSPLDSLGAEDANK